MVYVGGLTTFSSFALDTLLLFRQHHAAIGWGFLNIFLNLILCLLAVYLGNIIFMRSTPLPPPTSPSCTQVSSLNTETEANDAGVVGVTDSQVILRQTAV